MCLSVPCSEKNCVYHLDGICTLETASKKSQTSNNADCLYYKDANIIYSENQQQN